MRKKQIAIMILSLWFIVISYLMLLVGRFELALFFILGFIGFLMIAELIEPHYVKPSYVRYIRFIMIVGTVIFGAVIVQKLLELGYWNL